MKNHKLTANVLSLAVATALGTGSLAAYAQDDEIEEIIVKGIRGSLTASADIKRGADGVVDAISAEDIGKFPDTNLAESLQRITGVSIDRQNGEGNQIFSPWLRSGIQHGYAERSPDAGRKLAEAGRR